MSMKTLVSGTFRCSGGKSITVNELTPYADLIFSDYDTSVFLGSNATIECGENTFVFHRVPQSICSDGRRLYLLSGNVLSVMDKTTGSFSDVTCHRAKAIACSESSLFVVAEDDTCRKLVGDSSQTFILEPVLSPPNLKVKSIACGANFLLCLTLIGQIYSQGIGSRGQLGLGDLDDRDELTLVEALEPITVTRISAGKWHAACVTDTGDLYTWGWNECGQLGYRSFALRKRVSLSKEDLSQCTSVAAVPRAVDLPNEDNVVEVSCGSRHTVCLTERGSVYAFGWNGFGQLGVQTCIQATDVPLALTLSANEKEELRAKCVRCGLWSTTLLLENK